MPIILLQIEKETQRMKEDTEFRANPAFVLQKEPFVPQKVPRPLLTVDNVVLHSDIRSEQRVPNTTQRECEKSTKRWPKTFSGDLWELKRRAKSWPNTVSILSTRLSQSITTPLSLLRLARGLSLSQYRLTFLLMIACDQSKRNNVLSYCDLEPIKNLISPCA